MARQHSIAAMLPIELVCDILDTAVRVHSVGALKWTACLLLVSRDTRAWLLPAIYGVFVVRPNRYDLPWHTSSFPYPMVEATHSSGSSRQLEQLLRNPDDPRRAVIKTIIITGNIPLPTSNHPCNPWTVPLLIGADGLHASNWPLFGTKSYDGRADVVSRTRDPMVWASRYHREPAKAIRIQFQRENEWLQFIERTKERLDTNELPVHVHLQIELNYMFDRSVKPLVQLAQQLLKTRPQTRFVICTRRVAGHARAATREQLITAFAEIPRARLSWSTYFWNDPPRLRPGGHIEYLREGRDPWEAGDPL